MTEQPVEQKESRGEGLVWIAKASLLHARLEEAILAADQVVLDQAREEVERDELLGLGLRSRASRPAAMPEQGK